MLLKLVLLKLRAEALAPHHHSELGCFWTWTPGCWVHFACWFTLNVVVSQIPSHYGSYQPPEYCPSIPASSPWGNNSSMHKKRKPLNWASHNTCSAVSFIINFCASLEETRNPLKAKTDGQMTKVSLLPDLQQVLLTQTVHSSGHLLHLLWCCSPSCPSANGISPCFPPATFSPGVWVHAEMQTGGWPKNKSEDSYRKCYTVHIFMLEE